MISRISAERFVAVASAISETTRSGGRIYVAGNGGSASTAGHVVADLSRCQVAGRWVRVYSLADNLAAVTAWANDVCFERAFAAQVTRYVDERDLVLAISVSGRSPNVLAALRVARDVGARTVGLLGAGGGPAAGLCDAALVVPSADYGVVEVVHLAIAHAVADMLRGGPRRVGAADGLADGVDDPDDPLVGERAAARLVEGTGS